MRSTLVPVGILPVVVLLGCQGAAEDVAAPAVDVAVVEVFETRCASCHGAGGQGDGTASEGLDPKPRDFTSAEWQASVTDEHIERVITYGGAAVGKSAAMPSHPDLDAQPAVVLGLRQHIRALGRR